MPCTQKNDGVGKSVVLTETQKMEYSEFSVNCWGNPKKLRNSEDLFFLVGPIAVLFRTAFSSK